MRELKRDLAISGSDHPEIADMVEKSMKLLARFASLKRRGLNPDRVTYQWIISLYARAQDPEQVEKWAYEMEASGRGSTEAYNSVMFAFKEAPQGIDRADMWFTRMSASGIAADAKSYNILIQLCAFDLTRANRYFDRMHAAGIQPDVWTFSHLISACANDVQNPCSLQKAEAFWNSSQQAGLTPMNFTFMQLLKACANAGASHRASYFFQQSVELGFAPDAVTFTAMISVFIKKGDVRVAEEWFDRMQAAAVTPNVATFNCLMRVRLRGRRAD